MCSNLPPSTVWLSQPSQSSSSVAYTWRKSVWILQVAGVEVAQAGVVADGAALDAGAGHEQARGGAVVGALAGVLLDAAAELRERHQPDALVVAGLPQRLEEGRDAVGHLAEQVAVLLAWSEWVSKPSRMT